MMLTKNEYYDIDITDMGSKGEGIGRIDNFAVFVPNAVIGDKLRIKILKLKKSYAYGKIEKILVASKCRTSPICPVFSKCGGCDLQHINYEKQLEIKTKTVKDNLERIGGFKGIEVLPIRGMEEPLYYRNKVQLPVGVVNGKSVIGFFAKRSHSIIDIDKCYIQHPVNTQIIMLMREFIEENNILPYNEETRTGLIRHIVTRVGYETGEVIITIVINSKKFGFKDKLVEKLKVVDKLRGIVLNTNTQETNVILGNREEVIFGDGFITDYIESIKFEISPKSFYQINPIQTKALYKQIMEYADLDGSQIVIDAYCGIGTISLFLAQHSKKVYGIEIVQEAIDDANRNAEINNIDNVEFITGKSEEIIPSLYNDRQIKADVIVVDPPRKGCDVELLKVICEMKPQKLVYVSCDSATLSRDLKVLTKNGFRIEKVRPFDVFCQTTHVESIVLMTRKDG